MSAVKKKNNTKYKTYNKKKSSSRTRRDYEIWQDIKILLIIAVSVFLFVCNFKLVGKVGDFLSDIFFGLFGLLNYIFPLFAGFLLIFNELNPSSRIARRKTVFSSLLFVLVDMAVDLIDGVSRQAECYNIKEFYIFSKTEHKGGGVIAASFDYGLLSCISTIGTILVILVLMIISLIVLTEKSLLKSVKETTENVKTRVSEDKRFKEELYDERKKEALERQKIRRKQLDEEHARREKEAAEKRALEKQSKSDDKVIKTNKTLQSSNVTKDRDNTLSPSKTGDDIHEIVLNGFEPNTLSFTPVTERPIKDTPAVSVEPSLEKGFHAEPAKDENAEEVIEIIKEEISVNNQDNSEYKFPPISLLHKGNKRKNNSDVFISQTADKLEQTLETFGVKARVTDYSQGPTVTRFELQPDVGVKVSRIKNLSDDIKLSLAASEIRIEAPIPGKSAIGIEVPNLESETVMIRELIDSPDFKNFKSNLAFAVGLDITGKPLIYNIESFPHLLIAGATGSGKSVCINTLILSILYKANPDDVKLIMIDPKVVELSVYNGIPHLLLPVVTDLKKAAATLNYIVNEMRERYKKFSSVGARSLAEYNKRIIEIGENEINKKLPNIVVIVDEMAELMLSERKSVENSIQSLSEASRAAGIYLIIATQRPSVDIITGVIKNNLPSRMAFAVSSQIDSRTILDSAGAEELLGRGDMLFQPKGLKKPVRLQGAFVSDDEVNDVVEFLKKNGTFAYDSSIEEKIKSCEQADAAQVAAGGGGDSPDGMDELFEQAGYLIIDSQRATSGLLQRKLQVGFNRASRIIDQLADAGVVGPEQGTKAREILMNREEFQNLIMKLKQ